MDTPTPGQGAIRLGVTRAAVATAVALGVFYIMCWAGALFLRTGFTHMYLQLYTDQPIGSTAALGEGVLWSLLGGLVLGGLVSWLYNLLAFLDRR